MRFLQHCQGFVLIFLLLFANFRVGIKQRQLYKELLGQHLTFIHKFTLRVFFSGRSFLKGPTLTPPPPEKNAVNIDFIPQVLGRCLKQQR